jgi:hypothetical protein
MNKIILVIVAILAGIGLFIGGFFFGQINAQTNLSGWMMGNWNDQAVPGMMRNSQYGPGMMGNYGGLTDVDPLSLEDAETAVTNYLTSLNEDNLALGEIMIFDNHAYAQIIDETSGTGAFELLVDSVTQNVFPEPGPNMMWNTEYGMMSSGNFGMMGGMMNGQPGPGMRGGMMGNLGYAPNTETSVTVEEAVVSAQEYLDAYLPGKTAADTADAFPGYYTLHVLEDGETVGMLSVNAYTGQVFLHHWHGDFIEMAGEDHA